MESHFELQWTSDWWFQRNPPWFVVARALIHTYPSLGMSLGKGLSFLPENLESWGQNISFKTPSRYGPQSSLCLDFVFFPLWSPREKREQEIWKQYVEILENPLCPKE